MKKLLVAVIALFMGTTAFSQGIDLGVKVGANFATLSGAVDGLSNKTGFHAGAFAGVKFTNVGIQADLLYSQQGAKFDGGEFDLSYVNVPVVVKYYIFKGLNLQVGPQFGFVVDDNMKKVLGEIAKAESFDLSGVVGAGYDLLGLRFDARYNFGLTDVVDGAKSKNNVFSLALGYSFL